MPEALYAAMVYGYIIRFSPEDIKNWSTFNNGAISLKQITEDESFEIGDERPNVYYRDRDTGLFAYTLVNHKQKRVIFCVRGTDTFEDITDRNFDSSIHKLEDGSIVRNGFLSAWKGGEKDVIVNELSQLLTKYPSYSLFITGHSLGGTTAALAAHSMLKAIKPNTKFELVLLGTPRFGDQTFVDNFLNEFRAKCSADSFIMRFVYELDPIPGALTHATRWWDVFGLFSVPLVHMPGEIWYHKGQVTPGLQDSFLENGKWTVREDKNGSIQLGSFSVEKLKNNFHYHSEFHWVPDTPEA